MRQAVLRCKAVSKKAGGRPLLESVDLEVAKGELFGIVGAGGSGKSVLMHVLAGAVEPDGGDVQLVLQGGAVSVIRDPSARASVGLSPQVPSVYDDLTARENMEYFAALHGLPERTRRSAAPALLRLVGLAAQQDQLAGEMSAGQRKRLDVACALVNSPQVLLLDDPAAELDVVQRRELWRLLREIARKGTTVVIASNFLADLESLCDRIGILRNRRIAEVGTPEDLRVIYSHDFEIRLRTQSGSYADIIDAIIAEQVAPAKKVSKEGDMLVVGTANPGAALRLILAAIDRQQDTLVSVEVMRPTIQEVFESLSP